MIKKRQNNYNIYNAHFCIKFFPKFSEQAVPLGFSDSVAQREKYGQALCKKGFCSNIGLSCLVQ